MSEIDAGEAVATKAELDAIRSYIIPSLFSFLFCWLFGIAAISFSILTIHEKGKGNLDMARKHSGSAMSFMVMSYVLGIGTLILALIFRR